MQPQSQVTLEALVGMHRNFIELYQVRPTPALNTIIDKTEALLLQIIGTFSPVQLQPATPPSPPSPPSSMYSGDFQPRVDDNGKPMPVNPMNDVFKPETSEPPMALMAASREQGVMRNG